MTVTHPYAPYRPHSWIDYQVMTITGTWHPDSMALDVLTRTLIPPEAHGFQRITSLQSGGLIGQTSSDGGVVCNNMASGYPNGILFQDMDENGIGERSAGWGIGQPGVLILPNDITVGGVFNTLTKVWMLKWMLKDGSTLPIAQANTVPGQMIAERELPDFPSRCRVVYCGPWGHWPDTVRTALWEKPGAADAFVYNYVWQKDIGLIDFWYGALAADNTVSGIQMYGVAHGG